MTLSEAQYETILSKAKEVVAEIPTAVDWLDHALYYTFCYGGLEPIIPLPPLLCPVAKRSIAEIRKLLTEYLPKVELVLDSLSVFPTWMWESGGQWTDIKQLADGVSNSTGRLALQKEWEGDAGAKYSTGISGQSSAANGIAGTAGTLSDACGTVFNISFTCALAMAVGIVTFMEGIAGAIPSAGTTGVEAAMGAIIAVVAAVAELHFGIEQPERQMKGLLPIPYMTGGNSPAAGGWPPATQGS